MNYSKFDTSVNSDFATILTLDAGLLATKRFWIGPDGTIVKRNYDDRAAYFKARSVALDGVESLFDLLARLGAASDSFIVRGSIAADADRSRMRRRSIARPGEPATLTAHPEGHQWVVFDHDGIPAPEGFDSSAEGLEAAARWIVKTTLPEAFWGASFAYQWGASAGVGGWEKLSIHTGFWLDRRVCTESLREWSAHRGGVDEQLFKDAQTVSCAAPRFAGLEDPLAHAPRTGLLRGACDVVDAPAALIARPAWLQKRDKQAEEARRRVDAARSKFGELEQGDETGRLMEALLHISPEDRDTWVHVGMALHSWDHGTGRALWDQWASGSSKYSSNAQASAWRSFSACASGRTISTVYYLARQGGWRPPRPEVDQRPREERRQEEQSDLERLGAIVKRVSSGFVSEHVDVDNLPRRLFLRAPQGSGKTHLMGEIAAAVRAQGGRCLYICHRQTLCRDASRRLDFACYLDVEGRISVDYGEGMTVCLDSIARVNLDEYDAIFIDESDQVARHLYGKTIAPKGGGASLKVYWRLRDLLERAGCVVAADADLSPASLELVRGEADPATTAGELHVLHDGWPPVAIDVHEKRADINVDLIRFLSKPLRGCVVVQCSSRKQAERLTLLLSGATGVRGAMISKMLKARGGSLRVLTITSVTAQNDEKVKAFLADNRAFEGCFDVIISSPTLGTGVSIDWPVDRVYGIIARVGDRQGGRTVHDVGQHMWRFRKVRTIDGAQWSVWLQRRVDDYPMTAEEVAKEGIARASQVKHFDHVLSPSRGEAKPFDADHWRLYCEATANANRWRYDLRACFDSMARARGYRLRYCSAAGSSERTEAQEHDAFASEELRRREVRAIIGAEAIGWAQARELLEGGETTEGQRRSITRATITHVLGGEDRAEVAAKDADDWLEGAGKWGRRWAHVRALDAVGRTANGLTPALLSYNTGQVCAHLQPGENISVSERASRAITRALEGAGEGGTFEAIQGQGRPWIDATITLEAMRQTGWGIDGGGSPGEAISTESLKANGFIDWCESHQLALKSLGALPKDWKTSPVRVVAALLARAGVKLKSRQRRARKEGKRWREYWIDPKSASSLMRWSGATFKRLVGLPIAWTEAPAEVIAPAPEEPSRFEASRDGMIAAIKSLGRAPRELFAHTAGALLAPLMGVSRVIARALFEVERGDEERSDYPTWERLARA